MRGQRTDGDFHAGDPLTRQVVFSAIIIQWNDFFFEYVIEVGDIQLILIVMIFIIIIITNRPAIKSVVSFTPPAIEYREIQHAVDGGFFAGSAGGFVGTARGIQPDINTLNKIASHIHIVIFQENQTAAVFGFFDGPVDFLNKHLAGVIIGVGFACEDDLHRAVGAIN